MATGGQVPGMLRQEREHAARRDPIPGQDLHQARRQLPQRARRVLPRGPGAAAGWAGTGHWHCPPGGYERGPAGL